MQPLSIQVFILFFSINYFILCDGRIFQQLGKKIVKPTSRYLDLDVDLSNIATSNGASFQPVPSPSYPPIPLNPFLNPPSSALPNPTRPIYGPSPSPSPSPPVNVDPPRSSGKGAPPGQFAIWCVAKPTVPDSILQRAMDYACGTHAPDCGPIQPNGPCFQPNTLLSHASFAFNSYWQRAKQAGGTCDFGGTAMLVTVDPSFGKCDFVYV